jgi:hypothetical protein
MSNQVDKRKELDNEQEQEQEQEQEALVLIEFNDLDEATYCQQNSHKLKSIELDSHQPILQIGNRFYKGEYSNNIGTYLFFEQSQATSSQANSIENNNELNNHRSKNGHMIVNGNKTQVANHQSKSVGINLYEQSVSNISKPTEQISSNNDSKINANTTNNRIMTTVDNDINLSTSSSSTLSSSTALAEATARLAAANSTTVSEASSIFAINQELNYKLIGKSFKKLLLTRLFVEEIANPT